MKRLLVGLLLVASAAMAQETPAPPGPDDILRRQVEVLSRSGRTGEAIELLERRRGEGDFPDPLARRLVRLYRDASRWEDVETLVLEIADEDALDFGDLRLLADARYRQGRTGEAERTLRRALELDPNDPSRIAVVSNIYAGWGDYDRAIEVLLDARERLEMPLEFAQSLSRHYERRGDVVEALREACRVVAAGPLNLAIMRGQVVELTAQNADRGEELLAAAREVAETWPAVPQLRILLAEVALTLGEDEVAWVELRPLTGDPELAQDLLRIAIAGLADSRLPEADPERSLQRLRLAVRTSRALLGNEVLPASLEPRAYDTLVRSMIGILENRAFTELGPDEMQLWLDESRLAVLEMNRRYPGNRLAAAATLRLADVYTDALGDPGKAIELFGAVATDPSASAENMLLAELGLGRAYVAAGDTTQARRQFERIGADSSRPEGQVLAQYQLGLLDFMGGDFDEAEDRLKAVALKAPRANTTNDALDLAVLIAEEKFGGDADTLALRQYGVMLYQRATHQDDAVISSLQTLAEGRASAVRDRAFVELASAARDSGDPDRALFWVDRLLEESPMSREVPRALDLRGALLLELGRPGQARETWERILLEHESYVLIDQVRDRIAALRRGEDAVEGEVP